MARLPYLEPESAPPAVRELFDRLPAKLNVFKLMAHAETLFRPLLALGTAILAQEELPPRMRELAILRVARLAAAEYEWVQHVPMAHAAGVGEAQVEALRRGEIDPVCFDPVERLVLRFVLNITNATAAPDRAMVIESRFPRAGGSAPRRRQKVRRSRSRTSTCRRSPRAARAAASGVT